MEKLLGILSTWVPRDRSGGLTLELGIKSSSDDKHYYEDITMHNDYPYRSWNELDEQVNEPVNMVVFHTTKTYRSGLESRPWHRQSAGLALRRPGGFHATGRYLGSILQFQGLKNSHLPRVESISSLLIRHQFKRQISPLALGKLLNKSLVYTTSFRLERWCRKTTEEEEQYLKGMWETCPKKGALTNWCNQTFENIYFHPCQKIFKIFTILRKILKRSSGYLRHRPSLYLPLSYYTLTGTDSRRFQLLSHPAQRIGLQKCNVLQPMLWPNRYCRRNGTSLRESASDRIYCIEIMTCTSSTAYLYSQLPSLKTCRIFAV